MRDDNLYRDAPSFNNGGSGSEREFTLTDVDVEQALARLQRVVAHEPVPTVWMKQQTDAGISPVVATEPDASQPVTIHRPAEPHVSPLPLTGKSVIRRRRWGKFAGAGVAAVILVGLFTTPLGSKAMAAAMQTLYFNSIKGVSQDDMQQIENAVESGSGTSSVDLKQYGSVEVSGAGTNQSQTYTLDQASKLAGIPAVTLPGFNSKTDAINYTPTEEVTLRLNVNAINGLIHRLGGEHDLPTAVNGEPIVIHVPGEVDENISSTNGKFISLRELRMPTVEIPDGVNLDQVRQALLDLPFLPDDIRQSLAASQNWKDTPLFVPTGGTATDTTVNGYPAVMGTGYQGNNPSVTWLENGVLYILSGTSAQFSTMDSLIAQAKELAK